MIPNDRSTGLGRPQAARRVLRTLMAAAALTIVAAFPAVVRAQEMGRELGSALTPMPRPLIDKAKRLLNLDDDQFEIVKDLYDGYRSAYRTLVSDTDAKCRQVYQKARDDGNWGDAETKVREMMKKTLGSLERLDDTFTTDLRAILSGNQLAQFDEFARAKRRESTRHTSMLSGEGADPIDILLSLKIDPDKLPDFATASAEYAESLDRQIIARSSIWKTGYEAYLGGDDWKRIRDDYPKLYVVSKQIRDLNRRFARQIGEMLGEEDRTKFEDEFKKRSYPQIYKESVITKRLKAARNVEGLSDSQKDQLTTLEHSYEREAETTNARWRSWLDRVQDLIVSSANRSWNSTEAQEVRDVVEERVKLDKKYLDRIDAVLTPDQVNGLPATSRDMPRLRGDAMPDWDRNSVSKWLKDN